MGGNQWAGGTGGSDTAGLGGRGGPYRLSDGIPVHQVSDADKAAVSEEALARAREVNRQAYKERLAEIENLDERGWEMYRSLLERVQTSVSGLASTLAS